jgi:nucleoside-diphosphate-sugar epimerase
MAQRFFELSDDLLLRYGFIYGPEAGSSAFAAGLIQKRRMPLVGDGSGVWSWIHLEDAAEATLAALEKGRSGEVYNIVDDEPVAWRDYLPWYAKVLGAPPPRRVPVWLVRLVMPYGALSLTSRFAVSNAKARRELGWRPAHPTYREGLATLGRGSGHP